MLPATATSPDPVRREASKTPLRASYSYMEPSKLASGFCCFPHLCNAAVWAVKFLMPTLPPFGNGGCYLAGSVQQRPVQCNNVWPSYQDNSSLHGAEPAHALSQVRLGAVLIDKLSQRMRRPMCDRNDIFIQFRVKNSNSFIAMNNGMGNRRHHWQGRGPVDSNERSALQKTRSC